MLSPCSMESSSQWSTRPAARLIDGEDSHTILAIRKSGRVSSWKRRIEYVMWISNEYFVMIL